MMLHLNKTLALVVLAGLVLMAPLGMPTASADDTELTKQMEGIQDHMKKLRRTLKSPEENAQSLELLTKMQQATVASKALIPARAEEVPEGKERTEFVAGYRRDMAALLEHLCKIELAVLDKDNAKAEELFKGLKKIEDDGHEKYSDG